MKKSMKRVVTLTLAATMVMGMMTGCAQKEKEQVGLTWSNWVGAEEKSQDVIAGYIADFNATADANNQVTQINWPWGDTESQSALRAQGSEQYDIAQIDIKMLPSLAQAGILADLDEVFGADFFTSNFPQGSIEVGQYDGVQYGVPWTIAPMAMIANPTILKDSGVDFDIVTIEDFEKACDMVLNNHPANTDDSKDNDIIPYAAMTKDEGTIAPDYMVWMWTFGASTFDAEGNITVDSKEAIACMEWFASLFEKKYTQAAIARGDARVLFKEGRVAFYDDALAAKGAIYDEATEVLEEKAIPMVRPVLKAGDTPQAQSWGHLLVVIDRSPKKEEAKAFIEYLLSDEIALNYLDKCGMLPSTKTVIASDAVSSDYWMNEWKPILENGSLTETCGKNFAAYNTAMSNAIQSALNKTVTPEQACIDMQKAMEEK